MNDIVDIITSVGFPIVCVLGLAWYIKYKDDKTAAEFKEQRNKHDEEIKELRETFERQNAATREAVDNNTRALSELVLILKGGVNRG